MKDYYQILNVPKTATEQEIKNAYRKLAMKYHPDKNPNDKSAEEKFKQLSEAYDTLKDPQKRQMYNQFGSNPGQHRRSHGPNPFQGRGGPEEFPDLGDLFGDLFRGGAPRQQRRPRPTKGTDLRYDLNITLEEAASGCEKTIYFMRLRGKERSEARIAVTIPKGVKAKQRLKLSGEGDKATNNSIAGDLFVIINYHKHILFERIGNNLQLELPISFAEAIIGTTVKVPTLSGSVNLKIPAKTQTNQIFRLRKKGFPSLKGNSVGDMLVRTIIDIPENLTAKQIKLIKQLDSELDSYPLINAYKEKLKKFQ